MENKRKIRQERNSFYRENFDIYEKKREVNDLEQGKGI